MQGILNSSKYIDILVEARLEQMTSCYKVPMEYYMKKSQTWVFSSVSLTFLKPILFGQKFRVETEVTKVDGSMALVDFAFVDGDGKREHAKGSATYHLVDLSTKRPIDVPAEDIAIFLSQS